MSACLRVVLLERAESEAGLRGRDRLIAQSALARVALRESARSSGAVLGELTKDEEEAPVSSNGWWWSVSHARGFAGGVVCRERVGLDVEAVAERSEAVVERVASREELEAVGGMSWEGFVRVWTAKEAVLKKAGVGLLELGRCRVVGAEEERGLVVEHRGVLHVVRQVVRDGHVAAVTWDGAERDVAWEWRSGCLASVARPRARCLASVARPRATGVWHRCASPLRAGTSDPRTRECNGEVESNGEPFRASGAVPARAWLARSTGPVTRPSAKKGSP